MNRLIQARVKRKVAAYARVSTDHEDQLNSYEAQCDYYTNYIQANDEWEFVGVYSDEERPYPELLVARYRFSIKPHQV